MARYGLTHTLACLLKGQTVLRIRMNVAFADYTLHGRVIDVGGGRKPDYFEYFKKDGNVELEPIDGSMSGIDFEKDRLPYEDGTVDTVVLSNVLEHIYNYRHLLAEIKRILRPGGKLVGFVPFWIGYHPDPHDYFRYTDEALKRIFADAGFVKAEIRRIGGGPVVANFNTIVLSLPRLLRPLWYLVSLPFDLLMTKLRPESVRRNPLGFVFALHTPHA